MKLPLLYHIAGLCPRTDIDMGRCGFAIKLYPAWKEAWATYRFNDSKCFTQDHANRAVAGMGKAWLEGCGYKDDLWRNSIRVSWGEWGPEHICVPGNACGLDLDDIFGKPMGGKLLLPHNVDSIAQAHLLLVVFTFFADTLVLDLELKQYSEPK